MAKLDNRQILNRLYSEYNGLLTERDAAIRDIDKRYQLVESEIGTQHEFDMCQLMIIYDRSFSEGNIEQHVYSMVMGNPHINPETVREFVTKRATDEAALQVEYAAPLSKLQSFAFSRAAAQRKVQNQYVARKAELNTIIHAIESGIDPLVAMLTHKASQ